MITDDLLERGLGTLADGYDVPPHAVDDLLAQLRPAPVAEADPEPAVRRWPPTRRTWLVSSAAALVVLIVVAFAVGGGGSGGKRHAPSNADSGALAPAIGAPKEASGTAGSGTVTAGSGGGVASVPASSVQAVPVPGQAVPPGAPTQQRQPTSTVPADSLTKIVETGELDLQVDKIKVDDAVAKLTSYAVRAGGMVASSQTTAGDGAPSASVTLRVPNISFFPVLGQARGLGKVLSQQTKSADVTAQYVDLGARIHALGLSKQTYLGILSRATTIGQILSVQQQVDDIQSQIEQLQGQLKVLTDQTTYATLTVSIDQKTHVAPAPVVHNQSGMSKAVHRSVSRFVHGIEAIVGVIGPVVLVLLLLGLGWLAAKVGYRVVRRQMV
jgi:hypothetical protein